MRLQAFAPPSSSGRSVARSPPGCNRSLPRCHAMVPSFLTQVRSETGLDIEILSREAEARLAVSGCAALARRSLRFGAGVRYRRRLVRTRLAGPCQAQHRPFPLRGQGAHGRPKLHRCLDLAAGRCRHACRAVRRPPCYARRLRRHGRPRAHVSRTVRGRAQAFETACAASARTCSARRAP